MTVLDVLRDALKRIERDGWHQGHSVGRDGSVCALYAIQSAVGCTDDDLPPHDTPKGRLVRESIDALGVLYPGQVLVEWNDDDRRTAEEVTAAFRAAIARLGIDGTGSGREG